MAVLCEHGGVSLPLVSDRDHRCAPQVKPKKKKKPSKASVEKPLTQDEMLMQAAFTEIHNGR